MKKFKSKALLISLFVGAMINPAFADDDQSNKKKVYPTKLTPLEILEKMKKAKLDMKRQQFHSVNDFATDFSNGAIVGMRNIPGAGGLKIVQLDNDDTFLITGNGRFVIKMDVMLDIWKSNRIKKYSDLGDVDHVTLEEMRLNLGITGRFSYGKGKKLASIFVDPSDTVTKRLFTGLEVLEDEYVFRIFPVPSSLKNSSRLAGQFWCAVPFSEMFDFVLNGDFNQLPNPDAGCDVKPMQANIALASTLHIPKLPYIIRDDGLHRSGIPNDSDEFFEWMREED
jgi:hypothetical protein